MKAKINWFGLAGGIAAIALIIISMFVPWWQLKVGDDIVNASASPLNTNFQFIDDPLTIPLIKALNFSSIISLTAGGIAILIYSAKPEKVYSKSLLQFSYRKPLYSLLFFVISLYVTTLIVKSIFSFDVPFIGSTKTILPSSMTSGMTISVLMSAEFQWPFCLATVAAALCVAARLYHKRIIEV